MEREWIENVRTGPWIVRVRRRYRMYLDADQLVDARPEDVEEIARFHLLWHKLAVDVGLVAAFVIWMVVV